MKRLFLYILLFLITANAFSQQPPYACFTVDNPRGCAPLTVHMINCSNIAAPQYYDYTFGKNPPITTTDTTFTIPGTYKIIQYIFYHTYFLDTQTVEVLAKPTPKFSIETCQNYLVKVVINESNYDEYIINFGDNSPKIAVNPLTTTSHTYSSSTPRTVTVQGAYLPTLCGDSASQTVTPLFKVVAPDLQKLQVNNQSTNGSITLSFIAQSDQRYIVQQRLYSGGTFGPFVTIDTLKNLTGLNQYTIKGINTQANQYGYTITAFDDCGNTAASTEIVSIINKLTPGNNKNDISWNGIPANLTNYQVIKNQNTTSPLTTTLLTSFTDSPIQCLEVDCYNIIANMSVGGSTAQSISDTLCATGVSTTIPTAVQNFNSTYSGSSIQLTWNQPGASVQLYTLQRSVDGAGFTQLTTFTQNNYTDNSLNQNSNYCYQISYKDNCGNTSPLTANGTCAMKLTVEINPNNILQNQVSWTPYVGSGNSVSYTIEKLDNAGNVISSTPSSSLSATDVVSIQSVQVVRYRIKATDASGFISYSEIVEIKYEGAVKFPTAFTPNGDGVNDTFLSINKFIKDYQLIIYNRWGEVVFNSTNIKEGWDGMFNGTLGIPDAYAYLVETTDLWGKRMTQRGTVTLLK